MKLSRFIHLIQETVEDIPVKDAIEKVLVNPSLSESRETLAVGRESIDVLVDPSLNELLGFLGRAQEGYLRGLVFGDNEGHHHTVFWPGFEAVHADMEVAVGNQWGWTSVDLIEIEKDIVPPDPDSPAALHGPKWHYFGDVAVRQYGGMFLKSDLGRALARRGSMSEAKLLDVSTPSPERIAAQHRVPLDYVLAQLQRGIRVEHEHTNDDDVAREIALDHLHERPDYYERLKQVEGD